MPLENEDRPSDSPYVHRVWRSRASGVARMTSIATSNWELVFWKHEGRVYAAVRGPETAASSADVADGSEPFGIAGLAGPPGKWTSGAPRIDPQPDSSMQNAMPANV